MGFGADQVGPMKDAQTKARIASLEAGAGSQSRVRDYQAARSNPEVARRIKNETIYGIILLACIASAVYVVFFLLL